MTEQQLLRAISRMEWIVMELEETDDPAHERELKREYRALAKQIRESEVTK